MIYCNLKVLALCSLVVKLYRFYRTIPKTRLVVPTNIKQFGCCFLNLKVCAFGLPYVVVYILKFLRLCLVLLSNILQP
jgi:hypothetical protein